MLVEDSDMTSDVGVTITWLGHAATKIEAADGTVILIDPFLEGNPVTPESARAQDRVDLMLISHGHGDNMGDALKLAQQFQPHIIGMVELCGYLSSKGATDCSGGNTGGTQEWNGLRVTMVNAVHSSSVQEGDQTLYAGLAVGFIIRFSDGFCVYHAGDTDVFAGMELIGRLYNPDIALLPIGSHYTMGPHEAAEAIRLLGVKRVIPIHYGTFPILWGSPEVLEQETRDISDLQIIALKPGESVSQRDLT
jgi:L-ascorbate metabolism protein UlaG (beta-lactamase superfamily)